VKNNMNNASVFAQIIKQEKQDDGSLLVTGVATNDALDIDQQICDPEWLGKAMPEWFKWGNIREQHSNIAAGVATEYKAEGSQHIITARVVDPASVKKVEAGVLKGFSIGIRSPRVQTDSKAAGGRIVDGTIVEVSLVDRPANPTCLLSLAKSINGELTQVEELMENEIEIKSDSAKMCEKCGAPMGMDDKSCKMCDGLMGEHKAAEESSVEESSQEIGEESSQEIGEESSRKGGVAGVAGLAAKAEEMSSEESSEQSEGSNMTEGTAVEETGNGSGETAVPKEKKKKSVKKKLKSISSRLENIEKQLETLLTSNTEKFATEATEELAKSVTEVAERVSKVEKAASRGPVRSAVKSATPMVSENTVKAYEYRAKAAQATDPVLAKGYMLLADELEQTPTSNK